MDETVSGRRATMAEVRGWDKPQTILILADFSQQEDLEIHSAARTFGYLAAVAGPIQEAYQSDLWFDAQHAREATANLIKQAEVGSSVYWRWSVDDYGTTWQWLSGGDDIDPQTVRFHREYLFDCTLTLRQRNYGVEMTFEMDRVV